MPPLTKTYLYLTCIHIIYNTFFILSTVYFPNLDNFINIHGRLTVE